MPKSEKVPLEKVTLNLVEGDKETLASFYPVAGWSVAARGFINLVCKNLRELDSQQVISMAQPINIDISSIEDIEDT